MVGRATAFVDIIRQNAPDLYRKFEPILALPDPDAEAEMMRPIYDSLPGHRFLKTGIIGEHREACRFQPRRYRMERFGRSSETHNHVI